MKKIKLTQGKYALVDDEDYEWLNKFSWCYSHGYAYHKTGIKPNQRTIYMHRKILVASQGQEVDHKDGNKLNNQKTNLRFCTRSQNCYNKGLQRNNTSGYKGVYWDKLNNRWCAWIKLNGHRVTLGYFIHKIDAANIRLNAEIQFAGEFAWTNL